jgi:hypothetical protein
MLASKFTGFGRLGRYVIAGILLAMAFMMFFSVLSARIRDVMRA